MPYREHLPKIDHDLKAIRTEAHALRTPGDDTTIREAITRIDRITNLAATCRASLEYALRKGRE